MERTQDRELTSEDLDRIASYSMPFPLPEHLTPTHGRLFTDVSDETLMNAPPHLIAHMQRTAAQGGLQIVSPRQTPLSFMMHRVNKGTRELGDHVVGSVAEPGYKWPTLEDDDLSHLLPDEPLPHLEPEVGIRKKTRTEPLTTASHLMSDPILACLVKGRAVIDILRRPDVMGGADEMARLLADAWGVPVADLLELDAYSLGYEGPLLRHAIRADEVYPTIYAPVHQKRCISVGCTDISRNYLPKDSAIDWRRLRVFAEAIFSLSCSIEGWPLTKIRAVPPPGDPSAELSRRFILAFRPTPAIIWTFAPETFAITPVRTKRRVSNKGIPPEVLQALMKYTTEIRPMSHSLAMGHTAATKQTVVAPVAVPPGETIAASYRHLSRSIAVGAARGRDAAKTVRNLMYEALDAAPLATRLRIARYIHIASRECQEHLGTLEVPDGVIDKIAGKFLEIGSLIRVKVLGEAVRRGTTAEQWWSDIVSQAPARYQMMVEGTIGWARVGMWLTFKSPTHKWDSLAKAIHYGALRDAEKRRISGMPLPPEKESVERLLAAGRETVRSIAATYAGYYLGVADVGLAIADEAAAMGRTRTADLLREASYLWHLRARCYRATNLVMLAHHEETPSENHYRVSAEPMDLCLVPAPYRAFDAYRSHAFESTLVPPHIKSVLREPVEGRVAKVFMKMHRPIAVAKKTTVTRYLVEPYQLGVDMEQAWHDLQDDVAEVAQLYGVQPERELGLLEDAPYDITPSNLVIQASVPEIAPTGMVSYFDILARQPADVAEDIENDLEKLPEEVADAFMDNYFLNDADMRHQLSGLVDGQGQASGVEVEAVR